jgi:hypothetical protein
MRAVVGASLLWIALSAISDGVTTLVLPVRLATGTQTSEAVLGLVGSLGLVAGMLAQPFAGIASDRLRARVGRVSFAGVGVTLTVLALGGVAVAISPAAVAIAFTGLSLALAVTQAPQQALAAEIARPRQRGMAAGLKGFADLVGSVIGFALLGPLLVSGDVVPSVTLLAGIIVVTYGVVALLIGRPSRKAVEQPAPARQSDQFGPQSRSLGPVVASRFLFLLGIYAVGRFLVPFIGARLGLSIGAAADVSGGLLALLALVTAIGSLPAGFVSDRIPAPVLMATGAVVAAAGIGIMAIAPALPLITVGGLAMAGGTALFATANWRALLDATAGPSAGRLLGIANFGTAGAAAVAGLAGAAISVADSLIPGTGYTALFALAVLSVGASALVAAPPVQWRAGRLMAAEN